MSRNFLTNLKNKIAIITGASAGIGEAIAVEFSKQGCCLTLCGRDETRLEQVKTRCIEEGNECTRVVNVYGNIVETDVQKEIISQTLGAFGKIDILVNNAGVSVMRNPSNTDPENFTKIMKINLESVFFLTQSAIPHLIETKGCVINISSIASNKGVPEYTVYAMSKAALDSYTKGLALYLAPHQVRVNSVNPGSVATMIYRRGAEAWSDEQFEKFKKAQASKDLHPLGGIAKTSEVADSVAFLASDRASFITGQFLYVDGGRNIVHARPRL